MPKIATHLTEQEYALMREFIQNEAASLTEDEIIQKTQECVDDAEKWSRLMLHDPSLQDDRDRMYGRWVAESSEQAAIWAMVDAGKAS